MTPLYLLEPARSPLVINVPHAGIHVPASIKDGLRPEAMDLVDTDWFVDRLYAFSSGVGAGMVCATHSRYAVDLNRPPDDEALYSTRGTGLVPLSTFNGQPLYRRGHEPGSAECERRVEKYWRPYHEALLTELNRVRNEYGWVVLIDAHSIMSRVPGLFEGRLPDLNLGSYRGKSAHPDLIEHSMQQFERAREYTSVLDGRFQGGYITRHYGQPQEGVHALQLEMAQSAYMQEQPPRWDGHKARKAREVLHSWMESLLDWKPDERS